MVDLPKLRSCSSGNQVFRRLARDSLTPTPFSISVQISPDILSFDLFTEQFPVAYLSLASVHMYSSRSPSSYFLRCYLCLYAKNNVKCTTRNDLKRILSSKRCSG